MAVSRLAYDLKYICLEEVVKNLNELAGISGVSKIVLGKYCKEDPNRVYLHSIKQNSFLARLLRNRRPELYSTASLFQEKEIGKITIERGIADYQYKIDSKVDNMYEFINFRLSKPLRSTDKIIPVCNIKILVAEEEGKKVIDRRDHVSHISVWDIAVWRRCDLSKLIPTEFFLKHEIKAAADLSYNDLSLVK